MSQSNLTAVERALAQGDMSLARVEVERWLAEPRKFVEVQALSGLIIRHDAALEGAAGEPWRFAILGDFTTQPIALALPIVGLALGRRVSVYEADYNTYRTEALDPASRLHAFRPETAIFATSSAGLPVWPRPGASREEALELAGSHVESLARLWSAVRESCGAFVVQHAFEPPAFGEPAGRGAAFHPWTPTGYVRALNDLLWSRDGDLMRLLDVHGLAERTGAWNWTDPRLYFHSKHAFHPNHTADYALALAGLLRAQTGKSKKVLVTDLDNTLWGGTIGDDGKEGIAFSPETAEGEAYLSYARYLAGLRSRGVLLAVCSKNAEAVAREGFDRPGLPLDVSSFAAFVCNFGPKVENLRAIARDLNVGLDSLVFVDDDEVECASVREGLPEVTVVEMRGDPAGSARRLQRLALFDTLAFTPEDFARAGNQAVRRLPPDAVVASDASAFLAGLQMRARVRTATDRDLPRVEQLFKKTNQFNLTQTTFDAPGLRRLLEKGRSDVLIADLTDRHGHYGIVAALVLDAASGTRLEVRNWVVSCRVFSRTFEDFLLANLGRRAREEGIAEVGGEFKDTPRNGYARTFLEKRATIESGRWRFEAAGLETLQTHVRAEEGSAS